MKPIIGAVAVLAAALSACSYTEHRTVQPVPATATVVTPAPAVAAVVPAPVTATTYTTPEGTTTVYSR